MRFSINSHLALIVGCFTFFMMTPSSIYSQDSIPSSFIPCISYPLPNPSSSQDWSVVSIQGKLKMKGLPLSPSLKIFMQKDSLIDISIRAPFVGEAGRLVITPDSATAVNKINKTFVKEGIADFLKYYPGNFSDVQDLLLARFFIPGFNLREANLDELIDIYYENNQFNVIPKGEAVIPGITYGFVVDDNFNPLTLVVLPETRPDIEIDAFYTYSKTPTKYTSNNEVPTDSISSVFSSEEIESLDYLDNYFGIDNPHPSYPYNIQLIYQEGDKALELNLELKQPEWRGNAPKPLEINKKFKQVSFSDFVRSF